MSENNDYKSKLIEAIKDLEQKDMVFQMALTNRNQLAKQYAEKFVFNYYSCEQVRADLMEKLSDRLLSEALK